MVLCFFESKFEGTKIKWGIRSIMVKSWTVETFRFPSTNFEILQEQRKYNIYNSFTFISWSAKQPFQKVHFFLWHHKVRTWIFRISSNIRHPIFSLHINWSEDHISINLIGSVMSEIYGWSNLASHIFIKYF